MCQASFDWVDIHLPIAGKGANWYETTSELATDMAPLARVFFSDPWDFMGTSDADWAEYDSNAATYYGDPNPPEPVWYVAGSGGDDGGGCHNANGEPCEAGAVTTGAMGTTGATGKKPKAVFVPDPKTRADIVADFVVGIKRTHLNSQPGLESLTLEDGRLRVARTLKVRSVGEHPDYFLLSFEDSSTHRLYAEGTVNASGLLGAVTLESVDDTAFAIVTPATARAHASAAYGITVLGDAEPIFGYGKIGLTVLTPLFLMTDTEGRSIVVTPDGRALQVTAQGKNLAAKADQSWLRGKDGEQMILEELPRHQ
jgi:hypothetical protein